MSAMVCGKRSFFDDMDASPSPTATYKKCRRSSTSPVRFTQSPPVQINPIDQLKSLFPDLEIQLLEKALEESGNDLDSASKWVHDLCLRENADMVEKSEQPSSGDSVPLQEPQVQNNPPENGAEWVDFFLREMTNAKNMDDARLKAGNILESLEKSISARASSETAERFQKEIVMLKEHMEMVLRDNMILKRAVAIQHERQKENDEKNQEVHQLKQLLTQYQEQMRTLEMNNYTLKLHLSQAQPSNSPMHGRFNPDVY